MHPHGKRSGMGFFSGLKKIGGKVLGGIGDVARVAAPLASFIPGVGPIATAAIGAVGGALGSLNDRHASLGSVLGNVATGGVIGGVGGYGVDRLQGAVSGAGGLSGLAQRAGLRSMPSSAVAGAEPTIAGAPNRHGFNLGGVLGGVGRFIGKNPEVALMGLGALQNARTQTHAGDIRSQAVDLAREDMASRAPFRALALEQMKRLMTAPHTTANLPVDTGNPFAARVP